VILPETFFCKAQ
ncbi:Uncharacterized protein APZ42_017720, partial [Daphnia magna]